MNFDSIRKTYQDLSLSYQNGEIEAEEFERQVNALVATDSAGTHWQIGVKSGRWYRFDGQQWVEDSPPSQEMTEKTRWIEQPAKPTTHVAAQGQAPASFVASPPKTRKTGRIFVILGLTGLGLTVVCCAIIIGYAFITGQIQF